MIDATITRERTAGVTGEITNDAPDAVIDRDPTGGVTARLDVEDL